MNASQPESDALLAAIRGCFGKLPLQKRLERIQRRHGGTIVGETLYGATVDGNPGRIGQQEDGTLVLFGLRGNYTIDEDSGLGFVNPADWHGEPIPPRQWYVPDLVPMRQVTLLYGDGGVGKSLFALQLAAAGAMSVETLGLEPWAGRTVYLGAEDEADEFHRRLADIAKALGGDLSDLHLFRLLPAADMDALLSLPDKTGTMQPTALWHDFADAVEDYRPKLVVLDTAADLYGGDEIKRGQVRQFIGMLRKLAIKVNCAVILLAHPSVQGMQTGTGSSGSTGWSNSARARLYLTKGDDDDLRVLKTMKSNYGKTGDELRLRWHEGAFVPDDGKPSEAAGLMEKRAKDVFLRLLSETNRVGNKVGPSPSATYAPKVFADRKDAGGIKKTAFTDTMNELLADGTIAIVSEGRKGRETKRLVIVSEEQAQGRLSDPHVRPVSNPCQTLSDAWGGHPPITPSASDAASDSSDDGHVGLTASNDNDPSKVAA